MKSQIRYKKLKTSLFFVPAIVILIAFSIVILIFNLIIEDYIKKETSKQITQNFKILDSYYLNSTQEYTDSGDNADVVIPSNYFIVDEDYNVIYPKDIIGIGEHKKISEEIAQFLKYNHIKSDENKLLQLEINKDMYYIKTKSYVGHYEDYFISKSDTFKNKNYMVAVYSNITPIQKFFSTINHILLLLMIISSVIAIIIIFNMAKNIDTSFEKLKVYIQQAGQRKKLEDLDYLPYEEFNEVSDTVKNMSDMLEKAEESQKMIFQNASHELRTPLMLMQGYAEALKSGVIKDQEKSVDIILKESEKMSKLVDEILFLSKLDTNSNQMIMEEIELKELLGNCIWYINGKLKSAKIELEHYITGQEITICADEEKLERALLNILSNAIRYAKCKITIKCEIVDDCVSVAIIDDGQGISSEDYPHIFDRFYKGTGGNFGIGLAITKEIIMQHGGDITVDSRQGHTEFTVKIPIIKK